MGEEKDKEAVVLLAGVYGPGGLDTPDRLLDELESLSSAAGARVVGRTYQRLREGSEGLARRAIDPATFVGRGKAEHLGSLVKAHEANLVVFDNELSPAQIRELEKLTKCRVMDRSELILDIFAGRARTREAKLQVELAQLQYTAPRLRGMWSHLERQAGAGGVGLRGPGEKQIEIDRRLVGERLARLRKELSSIHGRRQREVSQRSSKHYCVGLVGYTNAGKSTLMNALTSAGTYAADQLFATLDTKTRAWSPGQGITVMLSDTVGFVRDLPHYLVASFRATLEEALGADLLLHVVDASHPEAMQQIETVEKVLAELECDTGLAIPVLNKTDEADPDQLAILRAKLPGAAAVSAIARTGLAELSEVVSGRVLDDAISVAIAAPAGSGELQAFVRANGIVENEDWDEDGWHARALVRRVFLGRLRSLASAVEATLTES